MPYATPDKSPAARPQPSHAGCRPADHARDADVLAAAPDAGVLPNAVLWSQDRARHRAVEERELERYMQWNEQ